MVKYYYSIKTKCLKNIFEFLIFLLIDLLNNPNLFNYLNLYMSYFFKLYNKTI